MDKLTDLYTAIVLQNPNRSIVECYNYFMNVIKDEEAEFVTQHFPMFIKIGEVIRNSEPLVQKELKKGI